MENRTKFSHSVILDYVNESDDEKRRIISLIERTIVDSNE